MVKLFGSQEAVYSLPDAEIRLSIGPGCLIQNQVAGPITFLTEQSYLVECNDECFLASVIVDCQPSGSTFEVPLDLDFRVGGPYDEDNDSEYDPESLDDEQMQDYMDLLQETYEVRLAPRASKLLVSSA